MPPRPDRSDGVRPGRVSRLRAIDPLVPVVAGVSLVVYVLHGFHGMLTRDLSIYSYAGQQVADGVPPYLGVLNRAGPLAHVLPGVGALVARRGGLDDGSTMLVNRGYVRPVQGTAVPEIEPAPAGRVTLDARIRLSEGTVDGRDAFTDFFWRDHSHIGEFDGVGKYRDAELLRGLAPEEALIAEKDREDDLRRQVRAFSRWRTPALGSPRALYDILRGAGLPTSRPRPAR